LVRSTIKLLAIGRLCGELALRNAVKTWFLEFLGTSCLAPKTTPGLPRTPLRRPKSASAC
jgi:hypothetical protein